MRRLLPLLAPLVIAILVSAESAQARPIVNMGTLPVGVCKVDVSLDACLVRRIWFSNHTDQMLVVGAVINGPGEVFHYQPRPTDCLARHGIPAHGSCFLKVYAGPLRLGETRGFISLNDAGTLETLRLARLLVTGT